MQPLSIQADEPERLTVLMQESSDADGRQCLPELASLRLRHTCIKRNRKRVQLARTSKCSSCDKAPDNCLLTTPNDLASCATWPPHRQHPAKESPWPLLPLPLPRLASMQTAADFGGPRVRGTPAQES